MVATRCAVCGAPISAQAKYCNHCGADVGEALARATRRCRKCGSLVADGASFCTSCGTALAAAEIPQVDEPVPVRDEIMSPGLDPGWSAEADARHGSEVRVMPVGLPSRELPRPSNAMLGGGAASSRLGSTLAALGAVIALVGCFLPLGQGPGDRVALIPTITNEIGYAYAIPVCAILIVLLAAGATVSGRQSRASHAGSIIAISSPWFVAFVLVILAAIRVINALGPLSFGTDIGVGLVALALGFGVTLAAGFVILHEVVATHQGE